MKKDWEGKMGRLAAGLAALLLVCSGCSNGSENTADHPADAGRNPPKLKLALRLYFI